MNVRNKGVLRVCYFGTYSMEEGYPRNRVIIEGLRRNGVEVIECHEDFWRGTTEKLEGVKAGHGMLKTLFRLLSIYGRLINKFRHVGDYDALIVGYAGHIDIFLVRFLNLFRRKPIIFDAFLSLYDTAVMDRRIVSSKSLKAKLLRLVDTWSCKMADVVLLDTQAHIDYFVKEFNLPAAKFFAVPVGSSLTLRHLSPSSSYSPLWKRGDRGDLRFEVLYFGSYIPLHGVDIILKAAKILQDSIPYLNPISQGEGKKRGELIPPPLMGGGEGEGKGEKGEGDTGIIFTLIGKGQLLSEMKQLATEMELKNVHFIDRFVEEAELKRHIQQADICLGIFGQTDKALRVIPCKVYNCLAMGKPLITAMTPATEGVLTHMENTLLCRPGDPEDLANAISLLKSDVTLREEIARHGQKYFVRNFSVEAIGKRVLEMVESL